MELVKKVLALWCPADYGYRSRIVHEHGTDGIVPEVLILEDDSGLVQYDELIAESFPVLGLVRRPEVTDRIADKELFLLLFPLPEVRGERIEEGEEVPLHVVGYVGRYGVAPEDGAYTLKHGLNDELGRALGKSPTAALGEHLAPCRMREDGILSGMA